MLDTAFGALKDFFSRGFIVGVFLPAFVTLTVNIGLFTLYLDISTIKAKFTGDLGITEFATAMGVIILLSTVLAFLVSPLLSGVRRIFEGDLLPARARSYWMRRRQVDLQAISEISQAAAEYLEALVRQSKAATRRLARARAAGVRLRSISSLATIGDAEAAVEDLKVRFREVQTTDLGQGRWNRQLGKDVLNALKAASDALAVALGHNSSVLQQGKGKADSERLFKAHAAFLLALDEAPAAAAHIHRRLSAAAEDEIVRSNLRPTRFGNLRAAMLEYPSRAYGVSFDFIWPRLQLVIKADDTIAPTLEHARSQLDFCLALWLLSFLSFLVWVITLTLHEQRSVWLLLPTWLACPLSLYALYVIAVESQRGYASAVIAAIDGYHLQLLAALGLERPANNTQEHSQWTQLQSLAADYETEEIDYLPDPQVGA